MKRIFDFRFSIFDWRISLRLGLSVVILLCFTKAQALEIFPVADLRPGMRGITHTVLQGSKIEPVETEVLGVAKNQIGPGLDLIICKLVDPKTALTGAVHGMSGSPLYIDGKIVGALSRRVMIFEKDGHCGFTPIADMLKVGERPSVASQPSRGAGPGTMAWLFPTDGKAVKVRAEYLSLPLSVSGLPGELLQQLLQRSGLASQGFVAAAGGGSSSSAALLGPETLQPGAPVAAVLMSGDISSAGTGTLTWREGNRVLGFGHPMLGVGSAGWPMGTAEIITTVPSYYTPFKMANQGQIVGTITQDRLSAIGGVVGQKPVMVPYRVERIHEGKSLKVLQGQMVTDAEMVPMLVGAALMSPLMRTDESSREFALQVEGELTFADLPALKISGTFAGKEFDLMTAVFDLLRPVAFVMGQDWTRPVISGLQLKLTTAERFKIWKVDRVELERMKLEPSETCQVRVTLQEVYGARRVESFALPLPESLKTGSVEVRVAGAAELDEAGFYRSLGAIQDARQLIERLNRQRSRQQLYVQLVTSASGQIIDQYELPSLPSSVQAVMQAGHQSERRYPLNEQVWLEDSRNLGGVVEGMARVRFEVK